MKPFSGKFVLRVEPELHEALVARASKENLSMNQTVVDLIKLGFKGKIQGEPFFLKPVLAPLKKKWGKQFLGLVLFGSQARQEGGSSSDWDLLLVLEEAIPLKRDLYRWWEKSFQSLSKRSVEPHFVHLPRAVEEASSIWFEVAIEGEILYQKNHKLGSFLEDILVQIRTGLLQREWSHGHPYWIRRENEKC